MMPSSVSILPSFPYSPNLLGNIDPHRTPGNTTAAANTSRTAELVDPRSQFVGHPLPVARLGGGSDTSPMDIRKTLREAGIPPAPTLGVVTGYVAHIFHGCTEARRADHGAIGAGQAACGNVIPARMLEVLVEKLFDSCGVDAAHLLACRCYGRVCFLRILFSGRSHLQFGEHLGATITACPCDEAVPL